MPKNWRCQKINKKIINYPIYFGFLYQNQKVCILPITPRNCSTVGICAVITNWLIYKPHIFTKKNLKQKGIFILSIFLLFRKNPFIQPMYYIYNTKQKHQKYWSAGMLTRSMGYFLKNLRRHRQGRIIIINGIRRALAKFPFKDFYTICLIEGVCLKTYAFLRLLRRFLRSIKIKQILLNFRLSVTTDRLRKIKRIKRRIKKRLIRTSLYQ